MGGREGLLTKEALPSLLTDVSPTNSHCSEPRLLLPQGQAQMGGEPRFQLSGSLSDLVDSQFSPFRHQHTDVRDRTLLPGKSQQQRKYRLLVHWQKQQ